MKKMILAAGVLLSSLSSADLVAWFPLAGSTTEALRGAKGEFEGDAHMFAKGGAAEFGGKNGVVFFPDGPQFTLPGSFSVSAHVFVQEWPTGGTSPAGQIVFRGDDRSALDNYSLNLGNDGYYTFYFDSADDQRLIVRAPAEKGRWQAVLGTFDLATHTAKLYVDGYLVSQSSAPISPIVLLEPNCAPGFSIGNVQNPLGGRHNQPFRGLIKDVRLWNSAVMWDEVERVPLVRNQRGGAGL